MTLFKEIFDAIRGKNPEICLIGIWGKDGLELEKAAYTPADMDLELLGAEIADVVSKIDKTKLFSGEYGMEYKYNRLKVFVSSLTPGYFLMVVSAEGAITGKLKFYLELNRSKLQSLL
jgi:predicted regulator of Ras-like GTPase activity (Roadblock/LC7/MglB family)